MRMRSMPRKSPITHNPDAGHCAKTSNPRMNVMTPSAALQPQPGSPIHSAPTSWNSPPMRKNNAMNRVSTSAVITGLNTMMKPVTPNRIAANKC
jgi:hypothetical protein